ncbi:MAG: FtsX-like permease family protein [Aliishimia sp.]
MIGITLQALTSHWRRNPLQLFTLLGGLILATALWCGVQAVNSEARASYDAAAATLGEGQFDQLVPRSGDTISHAQYITLRRAGWQVSPVIDGRIRASDGGSIRIVGLDPLTAPGGIGPLGATGDFDVADFLGNGPAFVTADTAMLLEDIQTPPLIIDPGIAPGTALTDIGVAQTWLSKDSFTRLMIAPIQPIGLRPLIDIAPELDLQPAQTGSDVGRLTDSFHLNLTAFGLLSFAVGIFIVNGAIGLAFEQRRPMVRTLRALGVPLRTLIAMMATELLLIALVGGLIGIVLGYIVASALLPDVAATLEGLYGAQVSGTLQLRASWWLSGLAICIAGTALAGSGAFWQIARMPLLASGQPRAWAMEAGKGRRIQALAACVLLILGLALTLVGQGLLAGFALLGCLLLGAALALPILLSWVLAFAQNRARTVTWEWFWADTRQQLPGLSLALMALLLAMAANVGVSTMVSSFRLTFTGFLDQRLSSELYIRSDDSTALEAFLSPRADEVLPLMITQTQLAGLPSELLGARIGQTYRDNWSFLDATSNAWDDVAKGDAILVNEQLARRADLKLGDSLQITPDQSLSIAGIFGDYGNPIGKAIIGENLFQSLYPAISATQFGVRTKDAAGLRSALIDELSLPEGNIIDQASIKAFSIEVFERTFTVTTALNVLTLSVAGFAMFMSLLTLATIRLPQLAPAWALGMTQRELGRLETIRAVVLAVLTAIFALPLGLMLAWVLLAIVNVEAFGWRLPMFFFPWDYARLGVFALIAAALAALWPAWRLSRTPPSDLLKVFAHGR